MPYTSKAFLCEDEVAALSSAEKCSMATTETQTQIMATRISRTVELLYRMQRAPPLLFYKRGGIFIFFKLPDLFETLTLNSYSVTSIPREAAHRLQIRADIWRSHMNSHEMDGSGVRRMKQGGSSRNGYGEVQFPADDVDSAWASTWP